MGSLFDGGAAAEEKEADGLAGGRPATPTTQRPLSSVHIRPQPVVTMAEGGNFMRVKFPIGHQSVPVGGRRGSVAEFTPASRRRLLQLLNSLDRREVESGHVRFVTLTYPASFPDPRTCKHHFELVVKRFQRAWGARSIVWKVEPQRRGAPHLHLLVFMGSQQTLPDELAWWAAEWHTLAGGGDPNHLAWHRGELGHGNRPCVEVVRDWNGVIAYAGKYLGKVVSAVDWDAPGRFWGVRGRARLPVHLVSAAVPDRSRAIQLARWIRRLKRQQMERSPHSYYVPGKRGRPGQVLSAELMVRDGSGQLPRRLRECWRSLSLSLEVEIRPQVWRGRGRGPGVSAFVPCSVVQRWCSYLAIQLAVAVDQVRPPPPEDCRSFAEAVSSGGESP